MKQRYDYQRWVVILAVLIAGCGYVPQGDTVHVSLYGENQQTESDIALDPISVTDSEFRIDGDLVTGGGVPDRETYRDVRIHLLSEESELICSRRVGDWDSSESRSVEVSSNETPHYVIILSPDFWNEPMTVEYFVRDDERDGFDPHEASSKEELPVRVEDIPHRKCT